MRFADSNILLFHVRNSMFDNGFSGRKGSSTMRQVCPKCGAVLIDGGENRNTRCLGCGTRMKEVKP
jgi:hypothetical protein